MSESEFQTVTVEVRDACAWIMLNRPEQLNAYNVAMRDDLFEVFSFVRDEAEIRCVVIHGAGRVFCAGADLTEFGGAPSPTVARHVRFARDLWGLIIDLEVPIVAAMHGHVIGSGLELAMFCDLRIAESATKFRMPEVRWGLIPAAGGTQTLPQLVGQGAGLDLLLTGRPFGTAEAKRLGLLTDVVGPDERLEAAEALVRRLVNLDRNLVRDVRRAVRAGRKVPPRPHSVLGTPSADSPEDNQ